jgi:hypothetical protein
VQLYGALNIDRNDAAARLNQFKRNYEFFNAPVALFIAIDRRLGPGQWADLGGYIHATIRNVIGDKCQYVGDIFVRTFPGCGAA